MTPSFHIPSAEKNYAKGETLFRQGDDGKSVFVILSGVVSLFSEESKIERTIGVLGPGGIVGLHSISKVAHHHRKLTARIQEDAVLVELTQEQLLDAFRADPLFFITFLESVGAL